MSFDFNRVRSGFAQVLPLAPQPATVTTFTKPVRLLEYNRPAHSPWLTVPLAEEEIVIQDAHEAEIVRFDYHDAIVYAKEMGLPTEFPL